MMATTLGNVTTSMAAAGTGAVVAAAAAPLREEPGVWAIQVLGITLSVLMASLAGSALRHLREPASPDGKLVGKAIGTLADGFIGGWLAMLVVGLPATAAHLGSAIPAEVFGAICALLVQFLRDHAKGYFDRIFETFLSLFARSRAGGGN